MGYMSRFIMWKVGETIGCLPLAGENYECDLYIECISVRYEGIESAKKETATLELL